MNLPQFNGHSKKVYHDREGVFDCCSHFRQIKTRICACILQVVTEIPILGTAKKQM